jgi:IstB-like ATP binding protein
MSVPPREPRQAPHDNLALVGPTGIGKSWCHARPKRLSRQPIAPLPTGSPVVRRPRTGARRWSPSALAAQSRPYRSAHSRQRGLEPLDAGARHDLLEVLEERYGRRSTMITSQLPVNRWQEIIGEVSMAIHACGDDLARPNLLLLHGPALERVRLSSIRLGIPVRAWVCESCRRHAMEARHGSGLQPGFA